MSDLVVLSYQIVIGGIMGTGMIISASVQIRKISDPSIIIVNTDSISCICIKTACYDDMIFKLNGAGTPKINIMQLINDHSINI